MPSTSTSTWLPTRPRTNGDPPPWFVFWTNTPGARVSASALVRGAVRSNSVSGTTDTERGTSNVIALVARCGDRHRLGQPKRLGSERELDARCQRAGDDVTGGVGRPIAVEPHGDDVAAGRAPAAG